MTKAELDGIRVGVLTVSDRVAAGTRDDAGGSALCELLEGAGAELVSRAVVPDEREHGEAHSVTLSRGQQGPRQRSTANMLVQRPERVRWRRPRGGPDGRSQAARRPDR